MNAQEKVLEYAKKNNETQHLTDEQFVGQMTIKGIVIHRAPGTITIAKANREENTIIVTETVRRDVHEVIDGKIKTTQEEEVTEVFRVNI